MVHSPKEEREKKKFEKDKSSFENSQKISQHNKDLVNRFIINVTQNRRNRSSYPFSYNGMRYTILKKICEDIFPNRNLDELTNHDIENFSIDLETDKIQNTTLKNPKPYSLGYKEQICKVFNSFFQYHFGRQKQKYEDLMLNQFGKKILNITSEKYQEKAILSYNEIKELIESTKGTKHAYYYACLFDGGFRIEEFLNVRYKDIIRQEGEKQDYYIFNITKGTKTSKPRKVSLYIFPEIIREYLEELQENYRKQNKEISPEDYIFSISPQVCNRNIKRHIQTILKRHDYESFKNHSLRHSSATYYALNVAEREADIYSRYGWAFGSSEAREYIQLLQSSHGREEGLFRKANIYEETQQYKEEIKEIKKRQLSDKEIISELQKEINELKNITTNLVIENENKEIYYNEVLGNVPIKNFSRNEKLKIIKDKKKSENISLKDFSEEERKIMFDLLHKHKKELYEEKRKNLFDS